MAIEPAGRARTETNGRIRKAALCVFVIGTLVLGAALWLLIHGAPLYVFLCVAALTSIGTPVALLLIVKKVRGEGRVQNDHDIAPPT